MSIPASTSPAEIVDRYVALTAGLSLADAAAPLRTHASYISKWRNGFRPSRLNGDLRARMVDLIERLEFIEAGPFKAPKPGDQFTPIDPKRFGERVQTLRLRLHLSQSQLAKRVKLRSATAVEQVEAGKLRRQINNRLLEAFAAALQVHVDELREPASVGQPDGADNYAAEALLSAAKGLRREADRIEAAAQDVLRRSRRASPSMASEVGDHAGAGRST